MTKFISLNNSGQIVTIDAAADDTEIKKIKENQSFVQLRKARTEESGFVWNNRHIKEVILKGLLIYDEMDVSCLMWFVLQAMKVDASKSLISPNAIDWLNNELNNLKSRGIKVSEGSSIVFPIINDFSESEKIEKVKAVCKDLGFTVSSALNLKM